MCKTFGLFVLTLSLSFLAGRAQRGQIKEQFSHADTLRGMITPERAWWDVLHYDIHVTPDYLTKTFQGTVIIQFKVLQDGRVMQIDLQDPLAISTIQWQGKTLPFTRDGFAYFVKFPASLKAGTKESILIQYGGSPHVATRPPWDGGWIFAKDELGRPWMSVACEGTGASIWYPCKDHLSDEPDQGAILRITVPDTLVAVGNGRLIDKIAHPDNHTATYVWHVVNPINNYNIIPYIGKYVTWFHEYPGEKGRLDCHYWVLDYDLEKARKQFLGVDSMLRCFEFWMGPYPFYEDGYKLVESPHLGMEHQSAVAYGNKFKEGYLGSDLSGTGWGLKWDFIVVHESGHEWFGNNISAKDIADEWIHESFTNYSETLYTGYWFGTEAGNQYNYGIRKKITNQAPIIGYYNVNKEPAGTDEYYKGGNMLHTIRLTIGDDSLFRKVWRGLNKTFYHQTVTAAQIESYISGQSRQDFSKIFDQYLRNTQIPTLEYQLSGTTLRFRWTQCVKGFNLRLKVQEQWIYPSQEWQTKSLVQPVNKDSLFDRNIYVDIKEVP